MFFSLSFNNIKKFRALFSILVTLIFIDQFSKYLIRSKGGFYICNPNISWGIPVNNYLFFGLWIIVMSALLFFLLRPVKIFNFPVLTAGRQFSIFNKIPVPKSQIVNLSIASIVSGAISNMIDRIFYGCVFDFIDLKFWPVFNLADSFIAIGAILLLVRWKKI